MMSNTETLNHLKELRKRYNDACKAVKCSKRQKREAVKNLCIQEFCEAANAYFEPELLKELFRKNLLDFAMLAFSEARLPSPQIDKFALKFMDECIKNRSKNGFDKEFAMMRSKSGDAIHIGEKAPDHFTQMLHEL